MKTDSKFKQKHKVGVAGSFINQMMANNDILPEIGKGATVLHYTDRTCYEVIKVSKDYKTVRLERLDAKADPTKQNGEGHQNWILEQTGSYSTIVWRYNAWRFKSECVRFKKEFIEKIQKEQNQEYPSFMKALTPEQLTAVYGNDIRPQNVVEGITEKYFDYSKVNIIFGRKDYYYDWSF